MARRSVVVPAALLLLAAVACGGLDDTDATTPTTSEPVPQTYAPTSDGVCASLALDDDVIGLGRLVAVPPSRSAEARGTTDRCVLDSDPPQPTAGAGGAVTLPEVVRVSVEVIVRTDGTAPPLDVRQFPIWRSDGVDAESGGIDGWWDVGVLGSQTLVGDDGEVHGFEASGAVRDDNLKVLVKATAERSADPERYRDAVLATTEALLASVGPRLR